MLIKEFYANREIFVTGGTGFLGKSLIEKLLRSCPKVKVIYLLLRGKKTISAEQRLEELKQSNIFERIRQECPEVLNKLQAIDGDVIKLGLGIKPQDMELLKNVSIIFHMAANVKFDNPFRNSILINTRGTYELVKIAEKLKNLVVFLHCSTAYCNAFEDTVEERVYKMPADWRKTLKMAETFDETTLDVFYLKYSGHYPNTYTFTKNLSEQIINEYSGKLPMLILRPSIVINSIKEPFEGYIDNMNGPLAGMVALSIGVTPVVIGTNNLNMDCMPVDLVTKMTLVATYKRGLQTLMKEHKPNITEVVNCAVGELRTLNMSQSMALYNMAVNENPMENTIWSYDLKWLTPSFNYFLLNVFFINIPFAIVMDSILRLMGREPQLFKIQRRLVYTLKAVNLYVRRQYKIMNKSVLILEDSIPSIERDEFGVEVDIDSFEYYKIFQCLVRGVKKYLFNQPIQASEGAIKRHATLKLVNKIVKYFFLFLFVSYLWSVVVSISL